MTINKDKDQTSQQSSLIFIFNVSNHCLFVCFVALRPKSTAMVIAGRSVHLTTLFSWASLNKQLTSNRAHTFACNWQQPFMNDSFSGREENDHRNYFMINLHESMGPGRDRTRDPWICSQLRICNQTRYRLHYAARYVSNHMIAIRTFFLHVWFFYWHKWQVPLRTKLNLLRCSL